MSDYDLIAYCGLYCGACSFKVAYDDNDVRHLEVMPAKYDRYKTEELEFCPGCRLENQCGDCKIRDCAISKNLEHCGVCTDFPCELIQNFNDDGIPHHGACISNLKNLQELGSDLWLKEQAEKWVCECGAKLSVYLTECLRCSQPINDFQRN